MNLRWFKILVISMSGVTVGGLIFVLFTTVRVPAPTETYAADSLKTPIELAAGIVPHHALADTVITRFFDEVATENPRTIILLSPDHFGVGRTLFTTTDQRVFSGMNIERDLRRTFLVELGNTIIGFDDAALRREHGLTTLVPYIQVLLPRTAILPIMVSPIVDEETLDRVTRLINEYGGEGTVVVSSVDFSHYLSGSAADFHDTKSITALQSFDRASFRTLEVDCWQCLYAVSAFAEMRGAQAITILNQTNSERLVFARDPSTSIVDEVTSYASMIFKKGARAVTPPFATMLVVGDIMVGRTVEKLMEQKSFDYPFAGIDQLFRGVDFVLANLEGPINKRHRWTPNGSTTFSFIKETPRLLKKHYINAVSLANNHTFDQGEVGFAETKEALNDVGVLFFGNQRAVSTESVLMREINGQKIAVIGLNDVYGTLDQKAAVALVKKTAEDPNVFVVVYPHWGDEYEPRGNKKQATYAHEYIDAGADLVIGHHPHVVQHIERYKERLIFYSLGNFIFDQYFSRETQEGLAVGVELGAEGIVYRLLPIDIVQSQPRLGKQKRAVGWLDALANRSDPILAEQIKEGIIKMIR